MNATTVPPNKDERYRIARLARRARGGLYTAEKQALAFIAETQTMQNGVCNKALKSAEDYGYAVRTIQWGIHGKHRRGKLEYPGLLARGIVYVVGGHPKGGLGPGGQGLTPSYAINLETLMTFIPIDNPESPESPKRELSEKGETRGETKGETLEKRGETKGVHAQTSSLSSSLTSSCLPSDQREARSNAKSEEIVVDGETLFSAEACGECPPHGHPTAGRLAAPTSGIPLPDASKATQKDKNAGKENHLVEIEIGVPDHLKSAARDEQPPFSRDEEPIAASHQRQLDRQKAATVAEIKRQAAEHKIFKEYKAVFDRLQREYEAKRDFEPKCFYENKPHPEGLTFTKGYVDNPDYEAMPEGCYFDKPLKTTPAHVQVAVELYRAIGREAALAAWEHFLVNEDHSTTERLFEEDGKSFSGETEKSWLLRHFVVEYGVTNSSETKS